MIVYVFGIFEAEVRDCEKKQNFINLNIFVANAFISHFNTQKCILSHFKHNRTAMFP
jgi:hypothetical protein